MAPRRRRRTVALILAALLATIVIHVGIAAAYENDGASRRPIVTQPTDTAPPAAATCDESQDPFQDPEFQDAGADGNGAGTPTDEAINALRQRL